MTGLLLMLVVGYWLYVHPPYLRKLLICFSSQDTDKSSYHKIGGSLEMCLLSVPSS